MIDTRRVVVGAKCTQPQLVEHCTPTGKIIIIIIIIIINYNCI